MKAVLFNGSPRRNGNTAALLACVGRTLEANGWEVETVHLGKANIHGCRGCQACAKRLDGHCAFSDDDCNALIDKIMEADAVVMGSPTYFTDVTAELKALIDRAGYVAFVNKWMFSGKIGAAVVAAGRAGATHAYDTINHMYLMNNMLVPGSVYWNVGFGQKPGEAVENDAFVSVFLRLTPPRVAERYDCERRHAFRQVQYGGDGFHAIFEGSDAQHDATLSLSFQCESAQYCAKLKDRI